MAKEIVKILFRGSEIDANNKRITCLQCLDSNLKLEGDIMYYSGIKKANSYVVGGIYEVQMDRSNNESTIWFGTMKYYNAYPDTDLVAELQASHRSNENLIAHYAKEKKDKAASNDAMLKTLEPLRRAWSQTNARGRILIELDVIRALRDMRGL